MKSYTVHSLVILTLLLSVSFGTLAQSAKMKAANKYFENLNYSEASRLYEDILRAEKSSEPTQRKEALKRLAFSYRKMNDSQNAERVYANLIDQFPDVESEAYLYYAQALASNNKTRESQKMYSKYGELQTADLRGKRFTVAYMDINRFYQDSSQYKIDFLPINTRQADFSPTYYKKGIVFVSGRDEGGLTKRVFSWNQTPFLDLYTVADTAEFRQMRRETPQAGLSGGFSGKDPVVQEARKKDSEMTKVEVFSRTLNTKYHEGPMTFFKDGSKVIFTRNNFNKGKFQKSKEGINKLKLYIGDLKGENWVNIRELPFNSNDYSTGHPALSPDNTKLYFVADMPGGYGGTDVYVVEYLGENNWGTPVNLGREINTEGNEMFPFIDPNGNLYFASDGHEGLGGLDIFFAEMKEGIAYKGIQNLGAPINSPQDDFGLITNGERSSGFFSSNRRQGVFDDNIYSFIKSCKKLDVIVYDADTKQPIEAADVRMLVNGENRGLNVTRPDGSVQLCLDSNREYEFKAIKEGYALNSLVYSTKTNSANHQTKLSIYLEKTKNTIVKGVVKSELTQQPMPGVKVDIVDEKTKTTQTVVTGADGSYEFEVKPNSDVKITASKDNYATSNDVITKPASSSSSVSEISMYGNGQIFKLKNIYYDYGRYFIRPDAARELDKLVDILHKNPSMRIEIRSHTDARSSDMFNLQLSENRARAAMDYLIARGIDASRLSSKGYGENELMNECVDGVRCTEDQHQQNRRTEFRVLAVQ
jgi:outer membrane protein OmpA-like peptidoglycan-associated protein